MMRRLPGLSACLPALALAMVLSLNGCFEGSTGGSETTNGLAGVLRDAEGKPAARAEVTLVPDGYNPLPGKDERPLRRTVADAAGRYRFARVAPGLYNVEAIDTARNIKMLVWGVSVGAVDRPPAKADGVLEAPGSVAMPFADRRLPAGAVAFIPGTTYHVPAVPGEDTRLALTGLPPGEIPAVKIGFADSAADLAYTLLEEVEVEPGAATAMTPVEAWRHARALKLDASGIPGAGSLRGYPMLLRLHAGNFDFSQAGPAGEDIRFARPDGTRLPYQIEHWDAAGKSAAVWIRLDSLPAASPDTSIAMHWGREDAVDLSSGTAVFDIALGFSAVWHLAEADNTGIDGYRDAASTSHATAAAPNAGGRTAAPAGYGKKFAEGGGTLVAGIPRGIGGNGSFSVSFWMRFGMAPDRQSILRFGADSVMMGFHFLIRTDTTAQFGPHDTFPDALPSGRQNHFSLVPHLGRWTHVATVYDADKGKLTSYVNGAAVVVNDLTSLNIRREAVVQMGSAFLSESAYNGALDEVRFYDRPLDGAWIRAEYETQKEASAVLGLK